MGEATEGFFRLAFRRAFGLARGALALLGLAVSFALVVPSVRDSIFQPPAIPGAPPSGSEENRPVLSSCRPEGA